MILPNVNSTWARTLLSPFAQDSVRVSSTWACSRMISAVVATHMGDMEIQLGVAQLAVHVVCTTRQQICRGAPWQMQYIELQPGRVMT